MDADQAAFFSKMPGTLPLYEAVESMVRTVAPSAKTKVHKTQVTFFDKRAFAFVGLSIRKIRGRQDMYVILIFGLHRQAAHPLIVQSVGTRPGRWTHHVIIQSAGEVDARMEEWIGEAYGFSMRK